MKTLGNAVNLDVRQKNTDFANDISAERRAIIYGSLLMQTPETRETRFAVVNMFVFNTFRLPLARLSAGESKHRTSA